MKKLVPAAIYLTAAAVICTFAFYGCGSTETAASSSTMSIDQAIQKSAEIRQQIQDAKTAGTAAQAVNDATGASKSTAAAVKEAVKEYAGSAAQPVVDEYNAWKDAVKK